MKTRDTLVGVFAGAMSIGAGFANAACDLSPPLEILEEGQPAEIDASCAEALETIDFLITGTDGFSYNTGPLAIGSDPNEVIRFQIPSSVRNQIGEYNLNVEGVLADNTIVSAPMDALVIVLDNPTTTVTTTTDTTTTTTDTTIDPSCPAPASTVSIVSTSVPTSNFSKTYWAVAPQTEYAFKFKTKDTTAAVGQKVYAARVSGADTGKLVEVSLCPGGPPVSATCRSFDAEASGFSYYVNVASYYTYYACVLKPNTTYYANVYSKYKTTDETYNCGGAPATTTSRCAFLYNQQ